MRKNIPQPDQIVDGKKYYFGIPQTLEGSRLSNKTQEAKIVKEGMKEKRFLKAHDISHRGPLPTNEEF